MATKGCWQSLNNSISQLPITTFWGLLLAAFLLSGCGSVEPVVKIGLVAPFEGQHRPVGYDVIYSVRLAVRQVNGAGGVGRYRVGLVALDDSGDPELAADVATALAIDPAVMVVVGHWLTETTAAAGPVYTAAGLPFIATAGPPFGQVEPSLLPADFRQAYAGVTPFEETAGPYAGPAYDAINLALAALATAAGREEVIDRETVASVLPDLVYEGITGKVYSDER
ncbi:MAG: ABC transporter substrate-binding protein [Chloroflexi bacterium]|nr:ABC transporter substrate-binding protein [Chloroflexota bacterium]MCI0581036.1 ABC transporter substrate-binding protein [Chloroflexota bacterium]MCI0647562.1 ABC transporter substrate-binding protein [Chloroflexota bacterium]MCI0729044.1 ABC transporter substrate-binding protein [Chloroflexota bacterium]